MQSSSLRRFFVFTLLLALPSVGAASAVEGVRIWSEGGNTRVVVDLAGRTDYRLFPLRDPDRLVIDFPDVDLAVEPGDLGLAAGVVRAIRVARRDGNDVRVVLDLVAAARPRTLFAGPVDGRGERLVIDLSGGVETVAAAQGPRNRDVVIAIDPGHGGRDPGAVGPSKTLEKTVVLAIGRELAKRVDAAKGMRALLIRNDDTLIDHTERMERARAHGADLFVSIHADGFHDLRARGSSVYALSLTGATSEAARRLADAHNSGPLVGGVTLSDKEEDLQWLLMTLSQNATISASVKAGQAVLRELATIGKVHKPRVQQANFIVLRSPDVPSILVETAFISNPGEERKLRDRGHQQKLAAAILRGVQNYFTANPPPGTYFAELSRGDDQKPVQHVVVRGDTLSDVAVRYNVRLAALRQANALRNDTVRIGQVLTIPSP
ncbi:MAG: N-acetylmuramoyl-L-alanine amidase [Pseudomonadota bacterium]